MYFLSLDKEGRTSSEWKTGFSKSSGCKEGFDFVTPVSLEETRKE